MWRLCDLHNHTTPNEQINAEHDPDLFVQACIADGLDLVAVTDHDHVDNVDDVVAAAAGTALTVVPGVEVSTDRGHILVLAPGEPGRGVLADLLVRIEARPNGQVRIETLLDAVTKGQRPNSERYAQHVVMVGAHVDVGGSLLAPQSQMSLGGQHALAQRLHALEVCDDRVLQDWTERGVKQGPFATLVQGSDSHDPHNRLRRRTWLYLPDLSAADFRHALAVRESSVRQGSLVRPTPPVHCIESIQFVGGHHDGVTFEFCERTNALIGPPNAGKSLIVDALKFVFDVSCDLPEIESVSESRRAKCLPAGSSIEVRVRTGDGVIPLIRAVGGSAPATPFKPIIFSQTELTRRAIASRPAMSLLDLHCAGVADAKSAIETKASALCDRFVSVLELAKEAAELRISVTNPVDGLAAAREQLGELAGTEEIALLAAAASQVAGWRSDVATKLEAWLESAVLAIPSLPSEPSLPAVPDLGKFVPLAELNKVFRDATDAVAALKATTYAVATSILTAGEAGFDDVEAEVVSTLAAAGFSRGSEVEARLQALRLRVRQLESDDARLAALERQVDRGLIDIKKMHGEAESARSHLSAIRRESCAQVNSSMRTFFARVDVAGHFELLDSLIEDLKTGTRIRATTRGDLRNNLDRFRLLEFAVRKSQGREVDASGGEEPEQDRVVAEALGRGRERDVARLACLWPGDSLELSRLGSPPTPFTALTEGLRALAIKEISFASSDLPVVTDQPEDAVPTRSVFESLVPTLRAQRISRQFLVVSHDANIVVASDIDRITVLGGGPDGASFVGSLADDRVRAAALEHLEGGSTAFALRAERYANLD